jgi:hypothetical protein
VISPIAASLVETLILKRVLKHFLPGDIFFRRSALPNASAHHPSRRIISVLMARQTREAR